MKLVTKLKKEIEKLKQEIFEIESMRPGSLTRQSRSWGKEYWQIVNVSQNSLKTAK